MLSGEFNQRINSNPPDWPSRERPQLVRSARHRNWGDLGMGNSDRENLRKHQTHRSPVHPAQNDIIILIVSSLIRGVYAAARITARLQQLHFAHWFTFSRESSLWKLVPV